MVKKIRILFFLTVFFFISILHSDLYSDDQKKPAHGDKNTLLKGCASCHKGHGKYNTPMLTESRDLFCFKCHGNSQNIDKAKEAGDIAMDVQGKNIQEEFTKLSHHPVENNSIHHHGETLPEIDSAIPRHVACGDCHHHHYVRSDNKMAGKKGTNMHGINTEPIQSEYELCFNCHSSSKNLPADQTNKAELFNTANPSFHPVIAPGKNNDVPSLIHPLSTSSHIQCTDCHNNDDPLGPKGPHGSKYKHLLSKNFNTNDGPEGISEYELCYQCHSRNSILQNESFFFHNLHVVVSNISCRTCHNPHGSTVYPHLIDLDNISIQPSSSGRLEFLDLGPKTGECYLKCHGKDHNPAQYPVKLPSTVKSSKKAQSQSSSPLRFER